jgi:rhomboid protease GluP
MEPYTIVRENWLTRKIDPRAVQIAALSTLALLLGSLMYWGGSWNADQWMSATRAQVLGEHQFWRAWTTLLVHADTHHLASNALLFFIMGVFLNGYFGTLIFPVVTFVMGGLTNLIVLARMPAGIELVGASGLVYWMGGFWLVLYFCLEGRRSVWQRSLRASGVALALFMPTEAFDPSVSYLSHLVGFISGTLFATLYYWILRPRFRAAEVLETVIEEAG